VRKTSKSKLVEIVRGKIPQNADPIEVQIILDDPDFEPTAGETKPTLGIWIDDSKVPKENRLITTNEVLDLHQQYKNLVFRKETLFEATCEATEKLAKGKGFIKIRANLKPNKNGVYWENSIPSFVREILGEARLNEILYPN